MTGGAPSDSDRMPDLAELIQAKLDVGESLRSLARASGDRIDHQTVDRWHRRAVTQFPRSAAVFEGFAAALGVSVDQVVLSMAVQLGAPVRRSMSPAAIQLPGADRLTEEQRRALRMLIKSIVGSQTVTEPRSEYGLAASDPETGGDGEPRRKRPRGAKDTGPKSR